MENEKKHFIYILTNPSFKDWVKIGYASDVDQRINDLNASAAVPFAFRKHAYLRVKKKNADKDVHRMIDCIDGELRSREKINGIARTREFFNITPEKAVEILSTYARVADLPNDVIVVGPSEEDIKEDEESRTTRMALPLNEFLNNQKPEFVNLFNKVVDGIKDKIEGFYIYTTNDYIGFKNKIGRTVAEFHFLANKVRVHTIAPLSNDITVGERVPDTFMWTLNYKLTFNTEDVIPIAVKVILESNQQTLDSKSRKRKESFSFGRFNIPAGSIVEFTRDNSIKPIVVDDKHIKWNGKVTSLSSLAQSLVGYICAGTQFFTYNGKLLADYLKENK